MSDARDELVRFIAKARVLHSFLPDDDDRSKNEYVADELIRAGLVADWEWGAIWTNGVVEGKWFDMGDSFAIREAAERQVDGYVDSQIVLGRRRKAGPWEVVPDAE